MSVAHRIALLGTVLALAVGLAPRAGAQTVPSPSPAASPAPEPAASMTPPPFAYIVTPPAAPVPVASDAPQILEVDVNDKTIHPGGPLNVRIRTTANIVAVEARAFGRYVAIPPIAPQTFALQYVLPCCLPFWIVGRNYDIVIAGGTIDGRQTTLTVPMFLARQ